MLQIAGGIIPALATTSALVSSLTISELQKAIPSIVNRKARQPWRRFFRTPQKFENFRNYYVNLNGKEAEEVIISSRLEEESH